jgi:ATP-dependent DNA helicase RecG
MSRWDLQEAIGLRDAEHFRKSYINPALGIKAIEMTIPEKLTSSKQRYRISSIGEQILSDFNENNTV